MLAAVGILGGCARADLPVARHMVVGESATIAACVYRQAQRTTDTKEVITQARLDNPEEHQVSKSYVGLLVWEVDVSPAGAGQAALTVRHFRSLIGWDQDMLKAVNACVPGPALHAA